MQSSGWVAWLHLQPLAKAEGFLSQGTLRTTHSFGVSVFSACLVTLGEV